MSHSSQSPPITDVLKELHDDKRLYRIVSFTEKLDDHITTESAFLLSILLGRKDWVDELHVFRRGFPKYLMRAAFQDLVRREMELALLYHFKTVFEEKYPSRRTITKQEKRAQKFRANMNWKNKKSGYHGVIVKPDCVDILKKTKCFVQFFDDRWDDNSHMTKQEKSYVWDDFNADTCLDWVLVPSPFKHKLREMEEKCRAF
ncbi:MAG: hypothetical protein OXF62_20195 [Caldilineaceae bacterium]|nr:hypothetical protein [Caldilineaceae bacterium]MCY4116270.1 hypothetical protein [Caldilineaceae bacterium]MDE0070293.1 hypothetical protein [Caldilineaceae bacterium]